MENWNEGNKYIILEEYLLTIMKIGDFNYFDKDPFLIEYDKAKHIKPGSFFKFYSLGENSVSALTTPYLYASHPNQLNDPFDCDKDMIMFDDDETQSILLKGAYNQIYNELGPERMPEFVSRAFNAIAYAKCGVFSMTTTPYNELMWAHYAGKDGFCLELDIEKFKFDYYGPYPINYQDELPNLRTSINGLKSIMAAQCNIKHTAWSYEDEWRLIIPSPEGYDMESFGYYADEVNQETCHKRRFEYPISAIKQIILGHSFFDKKDMESIKDGQCIFSITDTNKQSVLRFICQHSIKTSLLCKEFHGYISINIAISEEDNSKFKIIEQ